MKINYAVGVDIGGTNYRIALVGNNGKILKIIQKRSSHNLLNLERNLQMIRDDFDVLHAFANENQIQIEGLGVAIGCLVGRDFTVSSASSPEFLSEQKVDLKRLFPEILSEKVVLENDSKAAAWGEYCFGAGRGKQNLICLTIGTGIGGGIILNGRLLHGANGYAGHIGFMPIKPIDPLGPKKQRIYFEEWSSGTAIKELAIEGLRCGKVSSLTELVESNGENLTAEFVFQAAREGDMFAGEIIGQVAKILGIGVASLIHMFNPDAVILGGGVSEQGEILFKPVRKTVKNIAMLRYGETPIIKAELGNLAGVIGAASLALM